MKPMRPMEAVAALYADGHQEESEKIIGGLSRAVFGEHGITPAGAPQRALARLSCRLLRRTTTRHTQAGATAYRNPLLERSGHAYAQSLLTSTRQETEALVEGGDPMNGPYMMIVPEIRRTGDRWDRLFFNSVQGRDVQLRFIWETLATHEEARHRLEQGAPVSLKALAAGTGLSMILAYDRLVRDGYDPALISVTITDREAANTEKTRRLLAKLESTRDRATTTPEGAGITACTEDIFGAATAGTRDHDIVTAVGILEYLQGHSCETTEQRLGQVERTEEANALDLAARLARMTGDSASLIVNTYQPHSSTRILEVFGKMFDYRTRANMAALLAEADFHPSRLMGSGTIYDVEVYKKKNR